MLQRKRCVPFSRAAILVVLSSNSVAGATEEGSNLAASTRVETKTRFLQAIASQVGPEVLFGRCSHDGHPRLSRSRNGRTEVERWPLWPRPIYSSPRRAP